MRKGAPHGRENLLQNGCHDLRAVLCLCGNDERLTLLAIENRCVCGRVREEIAEKLADLARVDISVVEGGVLTQREHGVVKIHAYNRRSLVGELLTHGSRDDGTGQHEALQRSQADAVCEAHEVKVAKDVALALVDAVAEAVRKEGVAGETLCLLDEEAEGEGGGSVEGGGRSGACKAGLRVHDETADEVEIRVQAMLLGQLHCDAH